MFNAIPTQTISQVRDNFDIFCKWLSDNGINYEKSRIHKYQDTLKGIAEHFENNLYKNGQKLEPEYINTFLETNELINIYNSFSDSVNDSIKRKIAELISGPLDYKSENDSTNKARNISFELLVASKLKCLGLNMNMSNDKEDVSFHCGAYDIYIECKRPMGVHSINSNIKGAISQLKKRYSNSAMPNIARGVLAISITRALNPYQLILVADNQIGIQYELNKIMDKFIVNHKQKWRADKDIRTIGVLVHFSCISFITNQNIPLTTDKYLLVYLSNKNEEEERVINIIRNAFDNGNK